MKVAKMLGERFKEAPKDCVIASHALMMRGGYMKSVGNGIFTLSPVTRRITAKIEAIIREEMNRIGGQEVLFPVVMPAALCMILRALDPASLVLGIAVTHTAMPVAGHGTLLSMEYGGDTDSMAQITFLTTIASILTIPIVAVLLL